MIGVVLVRLDKFLCDAGAGTRSEVKKYIKKGRVWVNGVPCKKPECKIEEQRDEVLLDQKRLCAQKNVYYLFHKPSGVLSASRDASQKTVLDFLKDAPGKHLFPVGRLDKDTEGLLLLTNDGALAHRLLSPARHVEKTYLVHTDVPVTQQMRLRLEEGVDIGDKKRTLPARTKPLSGKDNGLYLTLTEGRFHQVKRMLFAVGARVTYLKRVSMGPLILEDSLKKGSWRELTEQEKKELGI